MPGLKQAIVGARELTVSADDKARPLGRVFWSTVGGLYVPMKVLQKMFKDVGIDKDLLPEEPRAIDAFKIATKRQEDKDYIVETYKDDIVQPSKAKGPKGVLVVVKCSRILVDRVTKDEKNLPIIGKWVYDPTTQEVSDVVVNRSKEQVFSAKTKQVHADFEMLKSGYNEKDIREMMHKAFRACHVTSLRPAGSVYFVLEEHANIVEAFGKLAERLKDHKTNGGEVELTYLPVVNTAAMRELVYVKFEAEVKGTIDGMLVRTTEFLKDKKNSMSPSQWQRLFDEYTYMMEAMVEYEGALTKQMATTATELDVLKAQLSEVAQRIRSDD